MKSRCNTASPIVNNDPEVLRSMNDEEASERNPVKSVRTA